MADPNTIFDAAYKGDYEFIKILLDKDPEAVASRDSNDRILLHWAAISGNVKLVTFLLECNSDVEACDDTETTPIILAASSGNLEAVKQLMQYKANVNHKTSQGHSALQYAASKDFPDICISLVEGGADINVTDLRGATPLHRAASKGNNNVVKYLLSLETIEVNARDAYGNTPLHLACDEDRQPEAMLLVANGARADIINKDRQTALDMCGRGLLKLIQPKEEDKS